MKLSKQELHNLAMNIAGKELENMDYEFLAISSKLNENPQFVCYTPKKEVVFVVVRSIEYPEDPQKYDPIWMQVFLKHARSKNATVLYAGVGLASAENPEKALEKDESYMVNFNGFQNIE